MALDFTVLSQRERAVVDLIIAGETSAKSLAVRLGVSPKTIEHHKSRLFEKLGVRSTVDLVVRALSERP